MNKDLPDLRLHLSDLKQSYIELESELSVARQVNIKLKEHISSLECQCQSNSQYSRRECLEISGIPDKSDQKDLEDSALNVFRKLDVEIDFSNIEDCHWLLSAGPNHVIIRFSKRKDANRIRRCKKNLKGMDLTSLGIPSPVFINDSLCQYYKMIQRKYKKLLTNKLIDSFWVSHGSIRLRVEDKHRPCTITHISDMEDLFPGNDLLRDEKYIICNYLVFSYVFSLPHNLFLHLTLEQHYMYSQMVAHNQLYFFQDSSCQQCPGLIISELRISLSTSRNAYPKLNYFD